MKKAAVLAVLLLLQAPVFAAESEPSAQLVEAIARQESGLNPLAVNIAGKSYYPATREEAERLIQGAIAAGRSFDIGMMQINSWWMEQFAINPFSLLDPEINTAWGKWILAQEIAHHGLNWQAVGRYHSPDSERGRRYAWLVYYHYAGQGASNVQQEFPHAEQKTRSQSLFNSRGIHADQGVSQQGGAVPFHVQQKGVPWVFRPKPGAPGSQN